MTHIILVLEMLGQPIMHVWYL